MEPTDFDKWKKVPIDFKGLEERNPKDTKIILGMTGGIDSTAAAFLLKKRGFQCVGISLVFINEEEIIDSIASKREQLQEAEVGKFARAKKVKTRVVMDEDSKFLQGNCSVKNLDGVNRICQYLGIPFYAVNAVAEFSDLILDQLVASKLSGDYYLPCVGCNNVKVDMLLKKAMSLGADFVATGHYAKIYKLEKTNTFHLFNSNDEENDQSHLLSKLEQGQLGRLVFPLADLRRNEVIKIIEKFKLPGQTIRDPKKVCFISHGSLKMFVEAKANEKLRPAGPIIEKKSSLTLGEHTGIHQFKIGEKGIEGRKSKGSISEIEKSLVIIELDSEGKVYLGSEEDLSYSGCGVINLNYPQGFDLSRPMNVFVKSDVMEQKIPGVITFKNNQSATIKFSQKVPGLGKGQHLTFYNKEAIGSKILGSGTISFLGEIKLINRTRSLEPAATDDEGNPVERKVSPFRF